MRHSPAINNTADQVGKAKRKHSDTQQREEDWNNKDASAECVIRLKRTKRGRKHCNFHPPPRNLHATCWPTTNPLTTHSREEGGSEGGSEVQPIISGRASWNYSRGWAASQTHLHEVRCMATVASENPTLCCAAPAKDKWRRFKAPMTLLEKNHPLLRSSDGHSE